MKKMKVKMKSEKDIEEKIIKIAIEITRNGDGALFVIGNNIKHERLFKQKFEPFNVFDRGAEKLLKGLAVIDGAVVLDKAGEVKKYGVLIKGARAFMGFGTRHAAAITASKNGNTSILCSEEEKKVKIFKNGRYIMQIDALQKDVEKSISGISTMLETLGAGFIGTIGVATLAPSLGLALIPGVLIFGGSYYTLKKFVERLRRIK
jgi:DNA integrity scanning protein DisA with diadenylate cyclase activity